MDYLGEKMMDNTNTNIGHWKEADYMDEIYAKVYICTACGKDSVGMSNYCPKCGAKMSEDKQKDNH